MRRLVVMLISMALFQNVFAKDVSIHCGKSVICKKDYQCIMLDGDYDFFEPETIVPLPGTYTLKQVSFHQGTVTARCEYSSYNSSLKFQNKPQPLGKEIFYHLTLDPDSIDYGWDSGDWSRYGPIIDTCDATKYACILYHK